jgi:mono/diheme cytochrome c family protein
MSSVAGHTPTLRRTRTWLVAIVSCCAGAGLAFLFTAGRPRHAHGHAAVPFAVARTDDTALPEDPVLMQELEKAIDLRRREDFDRMLDAHEPGELVEHATLTDKGLDRHLVGVDALFVVGDELFGYLFRPENGWGNGESGGDRKAIDYTPQFQRVQLGQRGGPDAFGCFSCHSKGGPDGAGTQSQNAFMRGDGEQIRSGDQRNAPHLLGLGPIALLAKEMSAALQAEAASALAQARTENRRIDRDLSAKGVSFGRVVAYPNGSLDYTGLQGVDHDLTVRPFGWKGHQATLRDMAEESLHLHQGLISNRIQFAVRDDGLDPEPYGHGPWYDVDEDGVTLEIDPGMLTTVVAYLAQLEVPVIRAPRDPGLVDMWAAGRARFDAIGCAGCHMPTLELEDTKLDARAPQLPSDEHPTFIVDVAKDGDGPKVEPKYAGTTTSYLVHCFSDLKRHDMGDALASPAAQGEIPARMFLTRPLWGLAETAPYLHDGRAPTVQDAIVLHGGEGAGAREAYLALDDEGRASVRVFLASLSRQPKMFVP